MPPTASDSIEQNLSPMLASELGTFVAHLGYDAVPPAVVSAIKIRILDLLSAGLVGYRLGGHGTLLRLLGRERQATVWGAGEKRPLRDAVLINSFMAHSTYLDDGSRYTGGHPSSVVIPSAIALAEAQRASGRELIASVAAGYEIFLRLGRAIYPSTVVRGFQSTAVVGAVASAAASATLLKLSAGEAANALAIACNLGVGLKEALTSSGSQPLQVARSCEGGLLAARYAQQGAAGAAGIIENGFFKAFADKVAADDVVTDLGKSFRVFETYIKVHGGCRGNHAPVDVVQNLVKAHGIEPENIERIVIHVDSVTYAAEIHEPRDGTQAQFSVSFSVAVALLEGNASIFQYTDEKIADSRIRAMMSRIRVAVDSALDRNYPDKRGARAELILKDGRAFSGSVENARGEPEYPLSASEVENKFFDLTREILGENAGRVRDLVRDLEKLREVTALVRRLRAETPASVRR